MDLFCDGLQIIAGSGKLQALKFGYSGFWLKKLERGRL